MPSVVLTTNKYHKFEKVYNLIHNFVLKNACRSGAYSLNCDHAAEEIRLYRNAMNVYTGRMVLYIRVYFFVDESQTLSMDDAETIAQDICEFYCDEYQIVYGVHFFANRWCLHFVINPINFHTGNSLAMTKAQKKQLLETIVIHSGFKNIHLYEE